MASPLEQFVNAVRAFSSHGNSKNVSVIFILKVMFIGSLRELCEYLNKSSEVLLKNTQHLDNVLETLDIQQHSLGILAVLCTKFSVPATAQDNRFSQAQDFILNCNGEQIRYAPDTCKSTFVRS